MSKGIVYLVGAGPGDLGLVTLRARELIAQADVLVYDYLAHPELVKWCKPECEVIYVGKKSGFHSAPQSEIEVLLVKHATAGKCVVRLKGGDPFVFGRGGEEARTLAKNDIAFEVVPGVTAALAAGAAGYLLKRAPRAELLDAIREVKRGGSPMTTHIARKVVQAFQPSAPAAPPLEHLAPREQQVLELLSKGRAYKQIAAEMDLHIGTVRTYIRRIYEKLHVNCRTDAVVRYLDAAAAKAPLSPRR